MSYFRPSRAVDLVSPVMACFVAVYGPESGRGTYADTDPLLMIRPPRGFCSFITRKACWVHKKAPVRFVSTIEDHSSKGMSSKRDSGRPTPALLKTTSMRP